jgi:hypothetical protein
MKKLPFSIENLKKTGRWLVAGSLMSLLAACGGGSDNMGGGGGYKANDGADSAPYFSVSGAAAKTGTNFEVRKTAANQSIPIVFFDDKSLRSYDITVDGLGIEGSVVGGSFSGTKSEVNLNIDQLNVDPEKIEGMHNLKVLVVDSAGQATVSYFTITILDETKKIYYPFLRLVGDATPGGWNPSDATPMIPAQPLDSFKFGWTGELKAGEFKISTQENVTYDNGVAWLHPLSQGQDLDSPDYAIIKSGGVDDKWVITEAQHAFYNITVLQKDDKIIISPITKLHMVGSATPGGWDLNNATVLNRDSSDVAIFTTTVTLAPGQFKFSSQNASYSDGAWLFALNADAAVPTSETAFELRNGGGDPDNKWQVSAESAGTYKFTVNLRAKTILATKQ